MSRDREPCGVSRPFDAGALMDGFIEEAHEHRVDPDSPLGRTLAEALAVPLTDAQRERARAMLLEFHRAMTAAALADGPADAATVDDRLQQIIPLRDRLIAEDPDAACIAFAVLAALYEHRLFPVCRPA